MLGSRSDHLKMFFQEPERVLLLGQTEEPCMVLVNYLRGLNSHSLVSRFRNVKKWGTKTKIGHISVNNTTAGREHRETFTEYLNHADSTLQSQGLLCLAQEQRSKDDSTIKPHRLHFCLPSQEEWA